MDLNELAIKVSNWAIIREINKKKNAKKAAKKIIKMSLKNPMSYSEA